MATPSRRKASIPRIVVGSTDSIPDVLTRLRAASGGPATIAIPASASLFLTASEFRALKAGADQARVNLTVETDDRLRRQLANMFQIPVVDLLPGAVEALEEVAPEPQPKAAAPQLPPREQILPELPRLDLPPPIETSPKWEPEEARVSETEEPDPEVEPREPRRPLPWKLLGLIASVFIGLTVVAGAAAFLLQKATVEITLRRTPVSAELTYAVVAPGQAVPSGAAFAIEAEQVTTQVPFRATIPTTGEQREPGEIASGALALRNPGKDVVDIPKGTAFTDRQGVSYTFAEDVSVPAADGNGAGRATGNVLASTGGETGNRDIGTLSGQLENGIYYSNRDAAIAGGTDRVTKFVSQADVDQLVAGANGEPPKLLTTAPLPDGRRVIPSSVQPGQVTYTIDHKVGDSADSVSIQASMTVTALAFRPTDAIAQGADQLQAAVTANIPAGASFDPGSLTYADPVLVNDLGSAGLYLLAATGNSVPVLTQDERDQVAEMVAGSSVSTAKAELARLPYVSAVEIGSSPGFLPVRIPNSAGRIEVSTR